MNLKYFKNFEGFFDPLILRKRKKKKPDPKPLNVLEDPSEEDRKKQAESDAITTRSIANTYPSGLTPPE